MVIYKKHLKESGLEQMSMGRSQEYYKHKIITIPNILSVFRLLLIPVIIWQYVVQQDYAWTAVLLILSGVTDVVDGFIARKFHMISDFGKAIDPVADKLTQIAMLYCLLARFPYMLLPLLLMVVKEFSAAVLALLVIRKTGVVCGAVWHGKLTTVLLYVTMVVHFVWIHIPASVSTLMIVACTAFILLSAVLYLRQHILALVRFGKTEK